MRGVCRLFAGAFAVFAAWPTTRSSHAVFKFFLGAANPALSCGWLFGIFDPTHELIAGQRCDVLPQRERSWVGDERPAQIERKFVHYSAGNPLANHRSNVAIVEGPIAHRFL